MVVENKPGASGTIGADMVAKAPPDGHTLLVINQLLVQASALYTSIPFDPLKDLIPLTDMFSSPLWLAVNTSKTTAKTMKEFVAQVKAERNTHNYASVGNGSIGSLYGHKLNEVAGLDMVHVPYKGAGPVVMALLAGEVSEQGFPGFESFSWVGIFVTGKTPPDVVKLLAAEVTKALKQPDVVAKLSDMALDPGGMSMDRFAAMVAADHTRWGTIIKSAGMKLD